MVKTAKSQAKTQACVLSNKKTFFISTTKRKKKNADLLENSLYDNGKIDLLL